MSDEGVTAIRGPLSTSRDRDRQGEGVMKMPWWIIVVIGLSVVGLLVLLLTVMKAGKMADNARWSAHGLDPERVRNEEEIAYLREWADRKAARKAARER